MTTAIDIVLLRSFLLGRREDSNKYDYGHALLICGCEKMPGAAVLATGATLHSGCGLVTLHSTRTACTAAMTAFPSAMLSPDPGQFFSCLPPDIQRYTAIGAGPGLGRESCSVEALRRLLESCRRPMVLDADALNILSEHREMLPLIPPGSVLTPHAGELKRLIGSNSSLESGAADLAARLGCVLVEKGPHTRIHWNGDVFINSTGNSGLAKGGSGDVLTGLVCGLLARGYEPYRAAILAVWLHGYAADVLSAERSAECWDSSELISELHKGFLQLYQGWVER